MTLSIHLSAGVFATAPADVLAIAVTDDKLSGQPGFSELDAALGGALLAHAEQAEFSGKAGKTLELPTLGRVKARSIILVGLGARDRVEVSGLRSAAAIVARSASAQKAESLAFLVPGSPDFRALAEGIVLGAYRFIRYFTGDRRPKQELGKVLIYTPGLRTVPHHRTNIETGMQVGRAVCIARDAVNEPPNELTPAALASIATSVARKHSLRIKVLNKKAILAAGMSLLYAVGQGSENEPRFVHLTYQPKKKAKRKLVFVGKGLTFDSGGLCIKQAPGMGEMKSDMGGAAAVIGLMAALGTVRPEVEVHGIFAAAENMPDGSAYRPGDIFGSLNGKTVEIINTDAEGRLVLADALAYATKLEPDVIIDAATLTGAAMIALGKTCSAFYASDDSLVPEVDRALRESGETMWRMPLLAELAEQLKSDVADLKHTGDRYGGSITAALFLKEFVGEVPWLHFDIAGPALSDRAEGVVPKGGTGHAVLTFLRLVENSA